MIRRLLQPTADLLEDPAPARIFRIAALCTLSLAAYGFATGFWRSPLLGFYVALKMPLLVALTLACNGLLNGLLGLLLGGLGFRESLTALLAAFASAALILGSLAPVAFMLALNAPPPDSPEAATAHAGYLLSHVLLIALAGLAGTLSLYRILLQRCSSPGIATVTMLAWLAGNGFLGAQFSWILRPFFGSPGLQVAFLREHPMRASFYEAVWASLNHLSGGNALSAGISLLLAAAVLAWPVCRTLSSRIRRT